MGIFSRLNRVIKSNLNSLLDQAEDPDKLIGQTVDDMKSALNKARQELVTTMGAAKRLDKKAAELDEEANDWERKAVLALEQDDEDLAREALKQKARTLEQAVRTREQAAGQAASSDQMRDALERIGDKVSDLEARRSTLASQVRKAREQAPTVTGAGAAFKGSAFEDLEHMADRIDQLDAEIEAHNVLDDPRRAELDSRFRELESDKADDSIEDELSELKKKLGG